MGCLQEIRRTANREGEAPPREKGHAFSVGSGRGHDWQRPLPIMAAHAANDGSGRCQPKFIDEYREMVGPSVARATFQRINHPISDNHFL